MATDPTNVKERCPGSPGKAGEEPRVSSENMMPPSHDILGVPGSPGGSTSDSTWTM